VSALGDLVLLDVTIARAGPTAVRQFSDWGATVIRIEAPRTTAEGGFTGEATSSDYVNLHRNKRTLPLNLKAPEGLQIFHRLVDRADVLIENFRPPVKYQLGIDYETLSKRNPRLIYGSISGFGQDGPYADKGAVDQIVQGMGGLMSITGHPEGGPMRAGVAITDLAAGHQLAIGILVALHERESSGVGQWVHVSLLESMISFLDFQATRWTIDRHCPGQAGNDHPVAVPMGTYKTADGHINIAASTSRLWTRLCHVLGDDELSDHADFRTLPLRIKNKAALTQRLERDLGTRSSAEWCTRLDEAGIPCGPIYTIEEVFADRQVEHLGMTVRVDHAERGEVDILRQPVTLSRTPAAVDTAAPMPTTHRTDILTELGYDPNQINDLVTRGVV